MPKDMFSYRAANMLYRCHGEHKGVHYTDLITDLKINLTCSDDVVQTFGGNHHLHLSVMSL